MHDSKYQWVKISESLNELPFCENNLLVVEVTGRKITLAKYNQQLFACAYTCPHASGILAEGSIDVMGNIVCPVHRYKFNLLNGRNISGEGYYLNTYPVKISEEGIFVGFKEKGFFDFL
jgi:nitrite reductase/ring-hydroxylating ferredoxin subunit